MPPATTALGSLIRYVTQPGRTDFQPMNANYGLFPPLEGRRLKGPEKKIALAERALAAGHATRAELEDISAAWREWSQHPDGWFLVPHGEIICRT